MSALTKETTPLAVKGANGMISFVVPFLNEEATLETLRERIDTAMEGVGRPYEIIFVDDGSTDGGSAIAKDMAREVAHVRALRFTRNFGKAAALSAGFTAAQGDIIITMDADLQDDPAEVPRFLEQFEAGYEVVSGWKKKRHDPLGKTLPSKVFNKLTSWLFDIDIHDINCGFKAYSRRAAKHLNLYGELHRFTPALLHAAGFRVTEIDVQHHPREHGVSKYGVSRLVKGFLDLITVKMVTRYSARPLHFFALLGAPLFFLGGIFVTYLSILWLLGLGPIGTRPLLQIGILLIVTGTQLIGIGLVAELIQTTRMGEREKYVIDEEID